MQSLEIEDCSTRKRVELGKFFTWTDVIEKYVKNKQTKKLLYELYVEEKNMPFCEFLKSDPMNAEELQEDLKFKILAIYKKDKYVKLLFDGRHSPKVLSNLPVKYFQFDQNGRC